MRLRRTSPSLSAILRKEFAVRKIFCEGCRPPKPWRRWAIALIPCSGWQANLSQGIWRQENFLRRMASPEALAKVGSLLRMASQSIRLRENMYYTCIIESIESSSFVFPSSVGYSVLDIGYSIFSITEGLCASGGFESAIG